MLTSYYAEVTRHLTQYVKPTITAFRQLRYEYYETTPQNQLSA